MGKLKLSDRLTALAEMVTEGNRLADVGCDHGYLPIYLCMEGRIPSALAMDVKKGPLSRAEEHIKEYGLTDRIQTRLSDGLTGLNEDEADTVLIAGMGGMLICRILTGRELPDSVTEMVLAPQSDAAAVRQCIRGIGFCIADEDMVCEDGKYYPMIKAGRAPGTNALPAGQAADDPHRQELEDAFGPVLLARHHPVLSQYLDSQLDLTEGILRQLAPDSQRRQELDHRRKLLHEAIEIRV